MNNRCVVLPFAFALSAIPGAVLAAVTFLPDYTDRIIVEDGIDKQLCSRAEKNGRRLYHLAPGGCPVPKIYDKACPHDSNWISDCYCPSEYKLSCGAPLRGNSTYSCDGLWASCCDTTCPEGSTGGCSYPYVTDHTTRTGCGDICSVCRYGNDCNTSCSGDEVSSYSGGSNDFNGQRCVTCSQPTPPPVTEPDTGSSGETGSGNESVCTDTCNSKGYKTTIPNGQSCTRVTVCSNTCYKDCKDIPADDPCKDVKCNDNKVCKDGTCVCPTGECCPSCTSGTCQNGTCVAHTHRYTCPDGFYTLGPGTKTATGTCSCGATTICKDNPCDYTTCPNYASCSVAAGKAQCVCQSGFHPKPENGVCKCSLQNGLGWNCSSDAMLKEDFAANAMNTLYGYAIIGTSPCAVCARKCTKNDSLANCKWYLTD